MVSGFGLSISLLGVTITHVRCQVAVAPFYVAFAWGCRGVVAWIRDTAILIGPFRRDRFFSHNESPPGPSDWYWLQEWPGRDNKCSNRPAASPPAAAGWPGPRRAR